MARSDAQITFKYHSCMVPAFDTRQYDSAFIHKIFSLAVWWHIDISKALSWAPCMRYSLKGESGYMTRCYLVCMPGGREFYVHPKFAGGLPR